MKVTLEMIDELRSRVNVTYEEAKGALEKNEGDLVKSIIDLEKKKSKENIKYKAQKANQKYAKVADQVFRLRVIIKKNDEYFINIPLVLAFLALIFAPHVVIGGLIVALIAKCKIRIKTVKKYKTEVKKVLNNVTEKIKETAEKIIDTEEANNDKDKNDEDEDENDEDEIIIE